MFSDLKFNSKISKDYLFSPCFLLSYYPFVEDITLNLEIQVQLILKIPEIINIKNILINDFYHVITFFLKARPPIL